MPKKFDRDISNFYLSRDFYGQIRYRNILIHKNLAESSYYYFIKNIIQHASNLEP